MNIYPIDFQVAYANREPEENPLDIYPIDFQVAKMAWAARPTDIYPIDFLGLARRIYYPGP